MLEEVFSFLVKWNGQSSLRIIEANDCQPREITPITYEDDFPFPYNNFVYAVDIGTKVPITYNRAQRQLGIHTIPPRLDTFIIRLPNLASSYNDKNRVQNKVIALSITRDTL